MRRNIRPAVNPGDPYLDRIIAYIPTEVIAAYTAISGLLKDETGVSATYKWVLIALVIITPVWTYFAVKDNPKPLIQDQGAKQALFHAFIAFFSFIIWVYALGDQNLIRLLCDGADQCDAYQPRTGAVVLILYTGLLVPLLERIIFGKPDLKTKKASRGFTMGKLGLVNVTAKFGEPRDGCPHKGTDFGSSGVEKDFKAGINGKVVDPLGGDWGTITIKPDHDSTSTVQYLHCSSIAVKVGDKVTRNQVIGKTGKKVPTGSPVTGIHLHLQVFKEEDPEYACWGTTKRNFYDPEKWDTGYEA